MRLSAAALSRNPVLLVHGFLDTSKFLARMASCLKEGGWDVHCLDLVPNNAAQGLEPLAHQLEFYIASNFGAGQRVDLVGFSMGGIVSRYYIQRLAGAARVRRFITIGSPHRGTWTAYFARGKGVRQMRPGSEFLRDLNRDCGTLEMVGFTSIWTRFDLMILPASSSVLPAGRSIEVGVAAHPWMATSGRVLRLLCEILDAPLAPGQAGQ